MDGTEQNPGGVSRTPRVVHTPAKRLRDEKGRNSRKKKKGKRKNAERQERERHYTEKMRNENLEERERERVYQQEKKNGRLIHDVMEMRRWRLAVPVEGNWIWDE